MRPMIEPTKNDIRPMPQNVALRRGFVTVTTPTQKRLHRSKNGNKHRPFFKNRNVTERHSQGGFQPLGWWLFVTSISPRAASVTKTHKNGWRDDR